MKILHQIHRLKQWHAGLIWVLICVVLAASIVGELAWLLLGQVPTEMLVISFVTTTLVASLMFAVANSYIRTLVSRRIQIQLQLQDLIFETTPLGVLTMNRELVITRLNPVLQLWLGPPLQPLLHTPWMSWVHPEDHLATVTALHQLQKEPGHLTLRDKRVVRQDGSFFWADLALSSLTGGGEEVSSLLAIITDTTSRKAAEQEINQLAFYDPLTGLPNRRFMMDRLTHALSLSKQSEQHGAVMFIDLDNFRTVNDTRGHDVGDLLLQRVARRLASCLRGQDTLARLGGDEFTVILEDLGERREDAARHAQQIAQNILDTLDQPYTLNNNSYRSSASLGVTLFDGQTENEDELFQRADIAMYESKAAGKNTLRFFEPAMKQVMADHAALEANLHSALQQKRFVCYFQVQTLHSHKIIGAEVLLRWNDLDRGIILPETFVPLAERNGLILPIGQWVLETACAQLEAWASCPQFQHLQLAINVSPVQFHQPNFVEQVMAAIRRHGVRPDRLKLELTESLVLNDVADTVVKMHQLRDADIRFSMDDFGTGYSSLAYLTQLPLDQLKIDQSFVRNIGVTKGDSIMVETIIDMAHNLGLDVIAEGVETEAQRAFLELHGCASFQGYLVGRPVTLAEFEALVTDPLIRFPALA